MRIEEIFTQAQAMEVRRYGPGKAFHGRWTLRELHWKVRLFNSSYPQGTALRRLALEAFFRATLIHEIRIAGMGSFQSDARFRRNDSTKAKPVTKLVKTEPSGIVILKRDPSARFASDVWEAEKFILFNRIGTIAIVRTPDGLRHLEIKLHTPCPD